MKAYVLTTGALFGLIVVAHIWRVVQEGVALAKDSVHLALTPSRGWSLFLGLALAQANAAFVTLTECHSIQC